MKTRAGNRRPLYNAITKMALAAIAQQYTSKLRGPNLKQNVHFGEVRVPLENWGGGGEPFCVAGHQTGDDNSQHKTPHTRCSLQHHWSGSCAIQQLYSSIHTVCIGRAEQRGQKCARWSIVSGPGWKGSFPSRPADSQLSSITSTICHIHTYYLLMMGYKWARNL
jgi:hypothetical protein